MSQGAGGSQSIRHQVRGILAQVGARPDLSAVADTDSLLTSGVVDSMAMVGLVTALETTFGITVGDTELVPEYFDSVNAITEFVARKTSAR